MPFLSDTEAHGKRVGNPEHFQKLGCFFLFSSLNPDFLLPTCIPTILRISGTEFFNKRLEYKINRMVLL